MTSLSVSGEEAAIHTQGLTKSYGELEAVRGLNLRVTRNGITAFLGQNGAGKSSTIKMLLGMMRPTAGGGTVLGRRFTDPRESCEIRQRVAYVAENKPLYGYMTTAQMVRFTSSFYPDWRSEVAESLIREYGLPRNKKVRALSKGMRTKLALLLAFSRRPDLLILDEPSEGLDPVGIEQLLDMLVTQSRAGVAVFFSSHQIAEVERVADRVCILDKGKLLVNACATDLVGSFRKIDVVFASAPANHDFRVVGIDNIRANGNHVSLVTSTNVDVVIERARSLNAVSVEVHPIGLRDIFLEAVREK